MRSLDFILLLFSSEHRNAHEIQGSEEMRIPMSVCEHHSLISISETETTCLVKFDFRAGGIAILSYAAKQC